MKKTEVKYLIKHPIKYYLTDERFISKLLLAFFFCLFLYFFLSKTALVIWNGYSSAPYFDGWSTVRIQEGIINLFSPHNEHRIVIIRILSAIDNELFYGMGYINEAVSLILLLFIGITQTFLVHSAPTVPRTWNNVISIAFFSLSFSALQFTNIVWSFQVGFVAAYSLGVIAIAVAAWAETRVGIIVALLLGSIAPLGIGGGLFCLPAILMVLLLQGKRMPLLIAIATYVGVYGAIYVRGISSDHIDSLSLVAWMQFSLAFLGGPAASVLTNHFLGWPKLLPEVANWIAIAFGIIVGLTLVHALTAAINSRINCRYDNLSRWRVAIFGILLFIAMNAVIVGYSREYLPLNSAYTSRYLTPSLIGFLLSALYWINHGEKLSSSLYNIRNLSGFILVVFIFLAAISQYDRIMQSRIRGESMFVAESALINRNFDLGIIKSIYPKPKQIIPYAHLLDVRGRSVFHTSYAQAFHRQFPASAVRKTCRFGPVGLTTKGVSDSIEVRIELPPSAPADYILTLNEMSRVDGIATTKRSASDGGVFRMVVPSSWTLEPPTKRSFFVMSGGRFCHLSVK